MYKTYRIPYKELVQELEYIEDNGGEIIKIETIITPDLAYLNNCTYDRADKHWVMIIAKFPVIYNKENDSNILNSFTSLSVNKINNNKIKKISEEIWNAKEC